MNGYNYSKMSALGRPSHKSRSVDFSDLQYITPSETEHGVGGSRDASRIKNVSRQSTQLSDEISGIQESGYGVQEKPMTGGGGGESFKAALSRSCSTASKRFSRRLDGQSVGAQCSAVKRAFSMRRSSSVSERYSRIHDQSVTQTDCEDEEEDGAPNTGPIKKSKNRGGKIIKACKRFFGL